MERVLDYCAERLERYRLHLASSQANGFLALLGLLSGVAAGLMIIAFRACANLIQHTYLPDLPNEAFEILDPAMHFAAPVIGAVVLALAYWLIPASARVVGVVHVLERLHYHQGHMPLRNLLVQFFGGAAALASGHSVGREGPSVHFGAHSRRIDWSNGVARLPGWRRLHRPHPRITRGRVGVGDLRHVGYGSDDGRCIAGTVGRPASAAGNDRQSRIIMPAMVAAALTARIGFTQESVFVHLMRDSGLDYRHDSVSQGLRRIGWPQ